MRRPTLLACLALFAAALALRLYRLDAQSLWLDEGSTWIEVTRKTWGALVGELWSVDAGYPLYHLLLKGWVALAGDSAWALRFPSALAGAGMVIAVFFAARELHGGAGSPDRPVALSPSLLASLLVAASPFALWYAQEAKAYSLLLLVVALELWALLRALRRPTPGGWLLLLALAVVGAFVHRLALFAAAGAALAVALAPSPASPPHIGRRGWGVRVALAGLALACGVGGVVGTAEALQNERGAAHADAGPLLGLGLTAVRFGLDRWPGEIDGFLGLPLIVWLLPSAALALWGLALLARDALARRPAAVALLCMLAAPLGLLAATLALTPAYEARYAVPAFPAWALALGYPLLRTMVDGRWAIDAGARQPVASRLPSIVGAVLLSTIVLSNATILFQPSKGLFSGDPVREQWREAITLLARRAHPDDLVILHPHYVTPMWEYYAPRVTPDPLPRPVTFDLFAQGFFEENSPEQVREAVRRAYEPYYNEQARGKRRALLLIAPDHARTVDPPPLPQDIYGWLGLRFQYPQRTWPCGGAEFVGIAILCQSYPEVFGIGAPPEPDVQLDVTFGGELRLRGYSLSPAGGALRPGGTLPVTLYWEAAAPPTRDYRMFLHLCRDCEEPPVANDDGPPLLGYLPAGATSTWLVGDPVHDERAVWLPPDLPPGRYTLLLGVYAGDGAPETRLPIVGGATLGANRLVLGEVEIAAGNGGAE